MSSADFRTAWPLFVTSTVAGGRVHHARRAGETIELACGKPLPRDVDVLGAGRALAGGATCRSCILKRRETIQPRHEASDLGGMMRRSLRGFVRRAAGGDTVALTELVALQAELQQAITDAGRELHDGFGYSYTLLAAELGITRQGARQRFTRGTPIVVRPFSGGEPE